MTTLARLSLNDRGLLRLRRFSALRAILIARQLIAAFEALRPEALDATVRAALAPHAERLRQRADALERHRPAPQVPPAPPELSEALLAVEPAEVLGDKVKLDRALERRIRRIDDATVPHMDEPEGDDLGDAARLIRERLFFDGRRFVLLALPEQYQETRQRLLNLGEDGINAARLLRREREVRELHLLNDHLGVLLGITRASDAPPAADPLSPDLDLVSALTSWLCAVNLAFPDDADAQNTLRAHLLRGLLDELAA